MNLTLIRDWNSLRCGFRMVGVPVGQAELLLRRQIAVVTVKPELKNNNTQQRKNK